MKLVAKGERWRYLCPSLLKSTTAVDNDDVSIAYRYWDHKSDVPCWCNQCPLLLWNLNRRSNIEQRASLEWTLTPLDHWTIPRASLEWTPVTPYKPVLASNTITRWSIIEKRKMTMASKDDNKHKYAADGDEEDVEEVPPKKQKMIDNGNNDYNGDDDDSDSSFSSSSIDYYLSEPEEEVNSEEEMNLLTDSEDELLIWRGRYDDRDTSDDEEEQFSDDD
jgi:hypothetical protein